jgi:Na+/citrate or Na+/malate symporter
LFLFGGLEGQLSNPLLLFIDKWRFVMETNNKTPNKTPLFRKIILVGTFVLLGLTVIANLFFDKLVEEFIYDGLLYITLFGLGVAGVQQSIPFIKKKFGGNETKKTS